MFSVHSYQGIPHVLESVAGFDGLPGRKDLVLIPSKSLRQYHNGPPGCLQISIIYLNTSIYVLKGFQNRGSATNDEGQAHAKGLKQRLGDSF